MTGSPIVFLDTETTALGHLAHPWEIAVIRREPDGAEQERVLHVRYPGPLPDGTSPYALDIGGYHERCENGSYLRGLIDQGVLVGSGPEWAMAHNLAHLLEGSPILVGVGVHFDAAVLSAMFRRHNLPEAPWHYGILDLKSATWGYHWSSVADGLASKQPALPMKSEALAEAVYDADAPDDDSRHTALGDARWARRWFDALTGGAS